MNLKHTMDIRCFTVPIFLELLFSCFPVFGLSQDTGARDWAQQFRTEAPIHWNRIRELKNRLSGTIDTEVIIDRFSQDNFPRQSPQARFAVNRYGAACEMFDNISGDYKVFGGNQDYLFMLRAGANQGEWVLEHTVKIPDAFRDDWLDNPEFDDPIANRIRSSLSSVAYSLTNNKLLSDNGNWFDLPKFEVLRAAETTDDKYDGCLIVECKYWNERLETPRFTNVELTVDPKMYWVPRRVRYDELARGQWNMIHCFEAKETQSGPVLSTKTIREYNSNGEIVWESVHRYSIDPDKRLSPTRFSLSHYGIPEPSWYRPPPPYWLYVSLASMALVIVGAVLIRFGKHLWRKG